MEKGGTIYEEVKEKEDIVYKADVYQFINPITTISLKV